VAVVNAEKATVGQAITEKEVGNLSH